MSDQTKPQTHIDLKGLLCPMPVVRISQAIKQVAVGATIEAVASDPGVVADIPAWARSSGHELVTMEKISDKEFRFVVKRLK